MCVSCVYKTTFERLSNFLVIDHQLMLRYDEDSSTSGVNMDIYGHVALMYQNAIHKFILHLYFYFNVYTGTLWIAKLHCILFYWENIMSTLCIVCFFRDTTMCFM